MMQPIRMRTAIEMRLFTSGKASSSSPVLVLKVPNSSRPGRPSYEISADQLQSLIDLQFTVPQITRLLYVSTRTIERRLAEYGISSRSFSTITDEELDGQVRDIKVFHPNCGSKNLLGFLASRNITVPRERLRQSLQRVDPIGVSSTDSCKPKGFLC